MGGLAGCSSAATAARTLNPFSSLPSQRARIVKSCTFICLHNHPAPPPPPPQGINSSAEVVETVNSVADLDRLLGIHAFSLDRILEEEPDFLDVRLCVRVCVGWEEGLTHH